MQDLQNFCILYFALRILHQGLTLTLQCKIGFGMRGWSGTLPNDAKNLLLVGLEMTQNVPNVGTYMASMGQGFSDPQCHMFNTLADLALGGWGFVRHHIRYWWWSEKMMMFFSTDVCVCMWVGLYIVNGPETLWKNLGIVKMVILCWQQIWCWQIWLWGVGELSDFTTSHQFWW